VAGFGAFRHEETRREDRRRAVCRMLDSASRSMFSGHGDRDVGAQGEGQHHRRMPAGIACEGPTCPRIQVLK